MGNLPFGLRWSMSYIDVGHSSNPWADLAKLLIGYMISWRGFTVSRKRTGDEQQ
jgi:hypothetical protein